jgi:hypothetical protein
MIMVAVYRKWYGVGEDSFKYIIDCGRLEDAEADGVSLIFEDGLCPENHECDGEMTALTDGYVPNPLYCVSLEEHERREKLK